MIQTAPFKPGSITPNPVTPNPVTPNPVTPNPVTPSSAALASSRPQAEASTSGTLRVGLQAVLNSLDVQLETELARYRRYKRLQQNSQASGNSVSFSVRGGALGVELPPVTPSPRVAATPMPTAITNAPPVDSQAGPVPRVSPEAAGSPAQAPVQVPAQSRPQPDAISLNAGVSAQVNTPGASLAPAATLDRRDVKADIQSDAQSAAQADVPAKGQVALASSLVQVGAREATAPGIDLEAGSLVPHPTVFGAWTQTEDGAAEHSSFERPQDAYFESSATLLEHLAGEPVLDEPEAIASPGWIGRLTSPMGIGLSLVLLVASGAVGYLWANPNSVSHLKWVLIPPVPQPSPSPTVQISEDAPAGPNLAQQEFVDLSLGNLGLVNTQPGVNGGLAGSPGSTLIPPGSTLPGIPPNAAAPSPVAGPLPGALPGALPTPLPTTMPGALPVSPGLQALPPVPTSPEANAASAPNPTGSPSASTPKPGLLSGLASAVSGNSVLRSLSSGPPLPAILQPAPTQPPKASPKSTAKPATSKPAANKPAANKPAANKPAASQPAASKPASSAQSSLPDVPINATLPIPPDQGSGFSVLVPFQGDESLAQIKAFAADAFVNTAGKIQVGIYDDAESARALTEFLRNQGINAEIGYP